MKISPNNTIPKPKHNGISAGQSSPRPRIALYSHDTQGLGHIRRNLLIAKSLSHKGQDPVILMLSGLRETASFDMPDGVDCLTLPALGKDTSGEYFPRSLGVSMDDLIDLRRGTIDAALKAFRPDVLIVDKVPLGAFGELLPALENLRKLGTRIVLGLREILDDAETVQKEWEEGKYEEAIHQYYDRVWVYGDPAVFDPVEEYNFAPQIADKVRYSGYLNQHDAWLLEDVLETEEPPTVEITTERVALCVVGGGRDGMPLAESFLGADLPENTRGVLITGPLMPAEERATLQHLADEHGRMEILEFVTDPTALMKQADRIIAMGGYNTMCEVVSLEKNALIVPRVQPRTEQLMRAEKFADLGLVDMLHPDNLSPSTLTAWLNNGSSRASRPRQTVDFNGAQRLPALLHEALQDCHTRDVLHAAG